MVGNNWKKKTHSILTTTIVFWVFLLNNWEYPEDNSKLLGTCSYTILYIPIYSYTSEKSLLYFKTEEDVKYPGVFKIPAAGMWH